MPQSNGSRSPTTAGLCQHGGQLRLLRLSARDSSRLPATNRRLFTAGRARRVVRDEDTLEVNLEHESARLHEAAGLMSFVNRRGSRRFVLLLRLRLHDRIRQRADAGDLDRHAVAVFQREVIGRYDAGAG